MTEEEVEDLIDKWHDEQHTSMPLHEYLGWTWEEYKVYVEQGIIPNA